MSEPRKEDEKKDDDKQQKKATTFKAGKPTQIKNDTYAEGVWDSIFRRMCEINYGCCCCASLRTGTLIFAWSFVFWFLLEIVGSILIACAYNGWIEISQTAVNDHHTVHKVDPFMYTIMALLQFSLSVVLLIGVRKESNLRFNFIRVFVQSFIIIIIIGVVYEAAKFVTFVSIGETNKLRIYGSLLGFVFLQGIYGWGTIVVKCYYLEVSG